MQYIIDVHTNSNPPPGFKLSMTALFVKWIWVVIVLVADMTQTWIPFGKDEGLLIIINIIIILSIIHQTVPFQWTHN